jgi:hypothetical protein
MRGTVDQKTLEKRGWLTAIIRSAIIPLLYKTRLNLCELEISAETMSSTVGPTAKR